MPKNSVNNNTEPKVGPDFEMYDKPLLIDEIPGLKGTTSLFNQYSVFALSRVTANSISDAYDPSMHFDSEQGTATSRNLLGQGLAEATLANIGGALDPTAVNFYALSENDMNYTIPRSKTPTAKNIIEYAQDAQGMHLTGPMPYSWADFLYCKYYGMIPNNNLVTLRRYPLPVYDNAKIPNGDPLPPIAQALTWMGPKTENLLSEIMSFSYGLVWKEIEAEVQELEGVERGFGAGAESLGIGPKGIEAAGSILTMMRGKSAQGRWSGLAQAEQDWTRKAWTDDGPYWNQVYGPVNVVHKTHMRDRGMNFDHTIKLNFHYSLKSINRINPKVAMLDLITNFLSLTYNNAKFWGGTMRYFPNYKDQTLFFGNQDAFYSGDWDGYFQSVTDGLSKMGGDLLENLKKIFTNGIGGLKEILGSLKDTAADMVLGKLAKQSRPHILSIRSLLSGDPIGEWHLTVGNPMNPIATIGNLIVTNTSIKFGDILGADDFPTEVTFIVELKHGKPRDKGDIESMFNYGHGRMTYSPLTRLPSEGNTFGEAWIKDQNSSENIGFQQKYMKNNPEVLQEDLDKYGDSYKTYDRVQQRMRRQWGPSLADTPNLYWLLNKTRGKF